MKKIKGVNNFSEAHHQSFKEYWQKKGTDFVLYVLGEYTIKGHECFTLIKITATTSRTTNKASGGVRIPVELLQILKEDAVKVLHSICQ